MIPYVKEHTNLPVFRTIDPTLLLEAQDYEEITAPRLEKEKYLLLYARRYNKKMFDYRGLIPKGLALEAKDGMYNN